MTARVIMQVFDAYQKARINFVQSVADLASKPYNITYLENAGAIDLLRPLLQDVNSSVQLCATIAIGRFANQEEKLANNIVSKEIHQQLLQNINSKNKYYKKEALAVVRSIAKHSVPMATAIVNAGGLEAMLTCIEDFDIKVKLAAVSAIDSIAKHNAQLSRAIIDIGLLPYLVLCLQEPDISMKQSVCNVFFNIAKHNPDLAQVVSDCIGVVPLLVTTLNNHDAKLKRQALSALSSIAKHTTELAESCTEAELFPSALHHIKHPCEAVSRAACILVRDTVKHSLELAQLVVNQGGEAALLEARGEALLPAITALGFISGHSDQLAFKVASGGAIVKFAEVLDGNDEFLLGAAVWSLEQIGKHSPEHSRKLAEANVFFKILSIYLKSNVSEDLKTKCKSALKRTLQKCFVLSALEPLLYDAPPEILKYVLGQFSKILPNDPKVRRLFVTTGGLKKVQEIKAEPGTAMMEYIMIINSCFPEEIVRFYSPGYPESLLNKVEQYTPSINIKNMYREIESMTSRESLDKINFENVSNQDIIDGLA